MLSSSVLHTHYEAIVARLPQLALCKLCANNSASNLYLLMNNKPSFPVYYEMEDGVTIVWFLKEWTGGWHGADCRVQMSMWKTGLDAFLGSKKRTLPGKRGHLNDACFVSLGLLFPNLFLTYSKLWMTHFSTSDNFPHKWLHQEIFIWAGVWFFLSIQYTVCKNMYVA